MKLNKILAISDIHIFNNKRFKEHEYVFNELEHQIKDEKPELILILGDVIDSKNKLSPEQILLARGLFEMLSYHSRVAFIIGNHDRSLQTDDRLDSLSTIVGTIENPAHEIVFLEYSEVYDLGYSNCKFAVWSWVENNKKPLIEKSKEDYIIGLYHGVIEGAITKDGHKLSGGIKLTEFDECDIVIAGDIHNKSSFRNNEIHYVSSLLQVSVNEDAVGGYMVYDWDSKKGTFIGTRRSIENPDAVETISIDDYENYDNTKIKNVRIKYDTDETNRKEVKNIAKLLSEKLGVKVSTYPVIKKKKVFDLEAVQLEQDVEGVEEGIDYFTEFIEKNKDRLQISSNDFKELHKLNDKFKTSNEIEYETGDFTLLSLDIDNLLSYKSERVDLSKDGLIGILGKNRAGKSSIIKIIQFVLFGVLPNNSTLYSFLNKNNRDVEGRGIIIFEKLGKLYKIERGIKPKKGKKADGSLNFEEVSESFEMLSSLNGSTKTETEKVIKKHLGINDYFEILSIFSAQKKQVEFIDCKNADRLSLLNKFLNLQEFEEKELLVKDELKTKETVFKTKVSDYENKFNLEEINSSISENTLQAKNVKTKLLELSKELDAKNEKYDKLNKIYNENHSTSLLNGDKSILNNKLEDLNKKAISYTEEVSSAKKQLKNTLVSLEESDTLYNEYKVQFEALQEAYSSKYGLHTFVQYTEVAKIATLESELKYTKRDLDNLIIQSKVDKCSLCGGDIKEKVLNELKSKIKEAEELIKTLEKDLIVLVKDEEIYKEEYDKINCNKSDLKSYLEDYNENKDAVQIIKNVISDLNVKLADNENKILKLNQEISKVDDVVKSKQIIESISESYLSTREEINQLSYLVKTNEKEINDIENLINSLNEKVKESILIKKDIDIKEKEIFLLKTFREVVGKKGLPLFVLNNNLENINNKINAIVSQVFDFELNFNVNDEKGEVSITFIYPDDLEANEVTLASGSETFLINLCIKVGLSQISQLPKISTLFVDEGYDVLDSESIAKLPNVFDVLKNYYNNIYTITHLDEVKGILDYKIELDKEDGYTTIT